MEPRGPSPPADGGPAEEPGWWAACQALALLLILSLSALGNGSVVLVIARHRALRTVPNALVLALSLGELLGALLCLPLGLLRLLGRPRGAWRPGRRLCPAAAALQAGLGAAATLSTALLAFDRYCALARPPRRRLGRRRAAQLLAGAWLAALGGAAPWYPLARAAGEGGGRCSYLRVSGAAYGAGLMVLGYLLPFGLMCFCHYHICRAGRRVRPPGERPPGGCGELRTATTVLILIVAVICCRGPYCLLGLAAAAGRAPAEAEAVASWLAWANGAVNPLVYAARNPQLAALLGRSRRGGYRTEPRRARARRPAAAAARALSSSSTGPASGGEVALWACKNPALLFCRDGLPHTGLTPKAGAADTSL